MDILNTNLLDENDKIIKIGDKDYKIPADIPSKLYLRLLKTNQSDDTLGNMTEGIDVIYQIFKIKQPDLKEEEFTNQVGINKYTAIINFLFADMSIEETMERLKEAKESIKDGKKKPEEVEN